MKKVLYRLENREEKHGIIQNARGWFCTKCRRKLELTDEVTYWSEEEKQYLKDGIYECSCGAAKTHMSHNSFFRPRISICPAEERGEILHKWNIISTTVTYNDENEVISLSVGGYDWITPSNNILLKKPWK